MAADPFLAQLGRPSYRSVGQRAATRAALLTPAGATTVIDLPTGEGKSLVFQVIDRTGFASDDWETQGEAGVTLVVVPTVALAYDHEAKCRRAEDEVLAYVGSGPKERRRSIVERLKEKRTGLVFAAPEAACGSLRGTLLDCARAGRLKAIVVDEAHLVDAWGTGFRTAFQSLSGLRTEAIAVSPPGRAPRTVMLSATLAPETLDTLASLFADPGEMRTMLAAQVRPEPDYWVAPTADEPTREARVVEALANLPRPLILYVTQVEHAVAWHARLAAAGYGRLACFHGRTPDEHRRDILERWGRGGLDVVVATSAFGLGIDYLHVRAVVHACVPETFDRFYQEIGRAGRDGCTSTSLVIPTFRDFATADGLNRERVISVERALERWRAMFTHADTRPLGALRFRIRLDVAPGQNPDDIDMIGERSLQWNARVITLMARSGLLRITGAGETHVEGHAGTYEVVELIEAAHLEEPLWRRRVEPVRRAITAGRQRNLALMKTRLLQTACPSDTVLDLYGADRVDMACGRCSLCRADPARLHPTMLRREPVSPWPTPPLDPSLGRAASSGLLVTYDPKETGLAARRRGAAAIEGAIRAGFRSVMTSGDPPQVFDRGLQDLATRPVFTSRADHPTASRLPRGPLLVIVGPGGSFRRPSAPYAEPRVVILPEDHPDPERPGERIADRWEGPTVNLETFARMGA